MNNETVNDSGAMLIRQKAHQFVLAVYNYSDYFPQKETPGLTARLRLAAISIVLNAAEAMRPRNDDRRLSLRAALRSVDECAYYLILAKDLGYGDHPELMPQLEEIKQMLEQKGREIPSSDS